MKKTILFGFLVLIISLAIIPLTFADIDRVAVQEGLDIEKEYLDEYCKTTKCLNSISDISQNARKLKSGKSVSKFAVRGDSGYFSNMNAFKNELGVVGSCIPDLIEVSGKSIDLIEIKRDAVTSVRPNQMSCYEDIAQQLTSKRYVVRTEIRALEGVAKYCEKINGRCWRVSKIPKSFVPFLTRASPIIEIGTILKAGSDVEEREAIQNCVDNKPYMVERAYLHSPTSNDYWPSKITLEQIQCNIREKKNLCNGFVKGRITVLDLIRENKICQRMDSSFSDLSWKKYLCMQYYMEVPRKYSNSEANRVCNIFIDTISKNSITQRDLDLERKLVNPTKEEINRHKQITNQDMRNNLRKWWENLRKNK